MIMMPQIIPAEWYLILGSVLFVIGILGVLVRKNVVVVLMCIELMLNAVNMILIAFSSVHSTLSSQIFVFFIMMVAAVEVAVGLVIFTAIYRLKDTTDMEALSDLKW
jgi:NADH-quinone oxidoreductase subunit K